MKTNRRIRHSKTIKVRGGFPTEPVITIVPSEDGKYAWVIEQTLVTEARHG